MAIMGNSGAGKATLLDILAMKTKIGESSGDIRLNEHSVNRKDCKDMSGFIGQDDFLLPTLTVHD